MTDLFLALLPGDGLILGAGHLLAHLAGDAPAHRLGRGSGGAVGGRLELQGDVDQGEHEGGDQEGLHGEDMSASSSAGGGRLIEMRFSETIL